jgi:hypothetical protein
MINQLPIYTIGDSHAKFTFSINDSVHPRIKSIFWIGPITMHRVGRDTIKFTDHHVPKDGFVISCFGEIDTRCHIKRQCDMQRDEDEIIQTIVTNYINTLQLNRSDGYTHIAIMNIVPTLEYQFAKDAYYKVDIRFIYNTYWDAGECSRHSIVLVNIRKHQDDIYVEPQKSDIKQDNVKCLNGIKVKYINKSSKGETLYAFLIDNPQTYTNLLVEMKGYDTGLERLTAQQIQEDNNGNGKLIRLACDTLEVSELVKYKYYIVNVKFYKDKYPYIDEIAPYTAPIVSEFIDDDD